MPEAHVFETGSNEWKSYASWPPANAVSKSFYLDSEGTISEAKPTTSNSEFDEYISDPANPVPHWKPPIWGWTGEVMHYDQSFVANREDVLLYLGKELTKDVTVAGPVTVDLYVSTSGTDADWVVKVIDLYPADAKGDTAGYQMLIKGDIMRGKFRNSFEEPEPFVPGKITRVRFTLPDVNHTFKVGHRFMIQIQSSWFPMFDRNPQTFVDIYKAIPEDYRKATHRIYRSTEYPSSIHLMVMPEDK